MNRVIQAPLRKRRILVFDVETTGKLPKEKRGQPCSISDYPHILQLSFVTYDILDHIMMSSFDSYINVAKDVEISEFITNCSNEVLSFNNNVFIGRGGF